MALLASAAALPRACAPAPRSSRRRGGKALAADGYGPGRAALGGIGLVLVSLPFVPAVAGIGGGSVRYSYEPRLTPR